MSARKASNTKLITKEILLVFLAAILITGCGPTTIGLKTGADIPLHTTKTSYVLNNESRSVGIVIGGVFDQSFSQYFGILFEPGISTRLTDQYTITAKGSNQEKTDMTITHEYSYAQLPLLLRFSLPIEGSSFKPFAAIGLRYLIGYSENVSSKSTTYLNNMPYLYLNQTNPQVNTLTSIDPTLCLGMDFQTSKSVTVRLDSRLHATPYDTEQYSIIGSTTSIEKNTVIPVISSITHLSFSFSMLARL